MCVAAALPWLAMDWRGQGGSERPLADRAQGLCPAILASSSFDLDAFMKQIVLSRLPAASISRSRIRWAARIFCASLHESKRWFDRVVLCASDDRSAGPYPLPANLAAVCAADGTDRTGGRNTFQAVGQFAVTNRPIRRQSGFVRSGALPAKRRGNCRSGALLRPRLRRPMPGLSAAPGNRRI